MRIFFKNGLTIHITLKKTTPFITIIKKFDNSSLQPGYEKFNNLLISYVNELFVTKPVGEDTYTLSLRLTCKMIVYRSYLYSRPL